MEQDRAALRQFLDQLSAWAATWGMVFNIKKCMVTHFGVRNHQHSYHMNKERLQETEEERHWCTG
jgi:hypothetical protein